MKILFLDSSKGKKEISLGRNWIYYSAYSGGKFVKLYRIPATVENIKKGKEGMFDMHSNGFQGDVSSGYNYRWSGFWTGEKVCISMI